MKEVMGFLARNIMEKYCKRFRSRIEAAVAADDNFIEKIDSQYIPLPTSFYLN
jgi:hypothetical protein